MYGRSGRVFGLASKRRMSGGEIIKPLLHLSRLGMGRGWVILDFSGAIPERESPALLFG